MTTKQLPTEELRDAIVLPSVDEFFNSIIPLENWLEINQKSNELIYLLSQKYAVTTVSRKLTDYRAKFNGYTHQIESLNEIVKTENGDIKQHRVIGLLVLNDDLKDDLINQREINKNRANGFNEDGSINEKTLSPIDVCEIIELACKLLKSNNPVDIVIALSLVTGRRCFELAVKNAKYTDGDADRDFQIVDDYRIGFHGIAKKSIDDMNQYQVIQCLIPSEIVFNAYQRLNNFTAIKSLNNSDNRDFTDSAFRKSLERKFKKLLGVKFKTIEDKEGNLHKCRAFYACVIKAILKVKNIKDNAIYSLIQKSLAHKNISETMDYLKRYESSQFTNLIDIPLTTNIKELGVVAMPVKKVVATVEKIEVKEVEKVTKPIDKQVLTMDLFISQLPGNVQVKIAELMSQGESLESILTSALIVFCESKQPKERLNSIIDKLFNVIKKYNDSRSENTKKVYPTYGLLNKIYKKLTGKELAAKTYNDYFELNENEVNKYLSNGENPIPVIELKTWNNKHHRKDTDSIIETVIVLYQEL